MNDADHRRWRDDVAAYLLGALEPGEAAEFERHVAGCADCQVDLRRLRPAVDLLPVSVERVEPPARLRAEILEQARTESAQSAATPKRDTPSGHRRWLRSWRPALGLAAVALIAAAVAGYAIRGGDTGGADSTTVLAGKAPAVTAQLVMEGDSATMHLANVREMPEDRVLEAWVQRDGEVERAGGLFVPDRNGRATAMISDMDGVEAVMVTSEPAGGSELPTSAPLVTARIKSG
jgi:anti-sigma-K factor RskA